VVAEVDEKNAAMVAAAVDPPGNTDGLADVGGTEVVAGVGAELVHLEKIRS
jgi:hypothetical protein